MRGTIMASIGFPASATICSAMTPADSDPKPPASHTLSEHDSKQLLAELGVPFPAESLAVDADDAQAGLGELAGDDSAPGSGAHHDRVDLGRGHG